MASEAVAPAAELANTGARPRAALWFASTALVTGAALVLFGRRRQGRDS